MKNNWVGSEQEKNFFEQMSSYVDRVDVAKDTVRLKEKHTAEYWEQMAVLCKEKARILKTS